MFADQPFFKFYKYSQYECFKACYVSRIIIQCYYRIGAGRARFKEAYSNQGLLCHWQQCTKAVAFKAPGNKACYDWE